MDDKNVGVDEKKEVSISPVKKMQQMVAGYAKPLTDDQRAKEFAARISIMAKDQPKIAQAIVQSPDSFLTAMMACVTLDLMPNTPEQDAHIIPYMNNRTGKMEIQYQTGYPGLLKLARRSGEIQTIDVELVFQGDTFDVELGTDRKIVHKPDFDVDRTDYSKMTHAYFTVKLSNGEKQFVVMTRKEIDKVQATVKAKSTDAPWQTWPEAMARKTVIKRAAKILPKSTRDKSFSTAVQMDSLAEAGKLHYDKEIGFVERKSIVLPEQASPEEPSRDINADIKPEAVSENDIKTEAEAITELLYQGAEDV